MSPETRQQIIALVLGIIFIVGFILFAQRMGQFLRSRQERDRIAAEKISPSPMPPAADIELSPTPRATRLGVTTSTRQPTVIPQTGPELPILASFLALFGVGVAFRRQKPR